MYKFVYLLNNYNLNKYEYFKIKRVDERKGD